jgi:hypothetical protein
MRFLKLLTLACMVSLVLPGCKQPPNISMNTQGKSSETKSAALSLADPIDAGKALALLYGNYDAKTKAAHADGERIATILAEAAKEGKEQRYFLVTATTPDTPEEAFDCEGCAPSISMAVFVRDQTRWVLEGHAPDILKTGMNGNSPGARLIATGPSRHDVLLESVFGNRGTMESYATVIGLVAGKPLELFNITTSSNDSSSGCWNDKTEKKESMFDRPCSSHEIELAWLPGPQPDRYDIHATVNGTEIDPESEDKNLGQARRCHHLPFRRKEIHLGDQAHALAFQLIHRSSRL